MLFRSPLTCIGTLLLAASSTLCSAQTTSDDPNYTDMLSITNDLTLYYSVVSTDSGDALSAKVVYQGLAWISVGVNPDGEMIGGDAIIGLPDSAVSSTNPGKYAMSDESAAGVVLMDSSAQTLMDGNVTQDTSAGTTTMTFTKLLAESGENEILSSGLSTFIYAMGGDNTYPSYHSGGRGKFQLDLSGATASVVASAESEKNYAKIFAAHGIMAVIAWAFLTPFAVASTFLRSLFSGPLWFKIHLYFNSMSFVLTATAFVLAVLNIPREELFDDPHFVGGWVLMGLATVQALAGAFRPHPEKKEEPVKVSHVVTHTLKSAVGGSVRAVWEVSHKIIGAGTLALALWQMQSGLKLMTSEYGAKSYLKPYWIWIVCLLIAVLILKIFAARRWLKSRPQAKYDTSDDV